MVENGKVKDLKEIEEVNQRICELGENTISLSLLHVMFIF